MRSAVMDHQYMLRHIRHQQTVAEASPGGASALKWAQLQDPGISSGVTPNMRDPASSLCRACSGNDHTIRDCPLMNVTQPPRVPLLFLSSSKSSDSTVHRLLNHERSMDFVIFLN